MSNPQRPARSRLPVSIYRLGEEPGDDLSAATTAEERLAMVWPLTLQAWTLSGRPLPTHRRDGLPVQIVPLATRAPTSKP